MMISRIKMCLVLLIFWSVPCQATVKQGIPDAARLQIQLKKLTVVGSALYIGAHPDDENTAALAYLSLGKGVRTAYLSLTRGEGGQNLIGSEQGNLLGLIRTQELLAARRIDGAEQFFTRAIDFGYSKTPEETLEFWGKEAVLSDVVWIIRKFRPDLIITRFPEEGGGHGNHIASGILAREAFTAAGDPARFPEQLKHVGPWQATRIVWNRYSWTGALSEDEKASSAKMEIGDYNAALGKSYSEIAGIARSMHKSQGFGDSEDRGKFTNYFRHTAGDPAESDLFEGIDLSWNRIPKGNEVGNILHQAYTSFRPENPAASIPLLLKALGKMNELAANPTVEEKKMEAIEAIRDCAGIWLEAISPVASAIPGSEIKVSVTAINRSEVPVSLEKIKLLHSNTLDETSVQLSNNLPVTKEFTLRIPSTTPYSQPYWLNRANDRPLAIVEDEQYIGNPESDPSVQIQFTLNIGAQHFQYVEPVFQRRVDPVRGELYRALVIVPPASVHFKEPVVLFSGTTAKNVSVEIQSHAPNTSGELKIIVPEDWSIDPPLQTFSLQNPNQTSAFQFKVTPGKKAGIARAEVRILDLVDSRDLVEIEYPHIPPQVVFPSSEVKVVPVDLKTAGKQIGYVMGSGDQIPEALSQVGYRVTQLEEADLSGKSLLNFDAIIVGVRALNARPNLSKYIPVLLAFARGGGTLLIQYHTNQDPAQDGMGPHPFRISRERVSVEVAPVTILKPEHSVLNFPNRITAKDFEGWVQERGLYFPDQWDPNYETILSSHDPGESPKDGGILFARVGKGAYIFTSYSWFRQLPAGVPGAIRLFVNLISAGKAND